MALKKPLMAEPDLEAQLPPIPELAPGQLDPPPRDFDNGEEKVYGSMLGIDFDWFVWKHKVRRLTARPGYDRSLLDRQDMRFYVLPAVVASVIIAEGYSKNWEYMTMVAENMFFLFLVGLAMLQPAAFAVYQWYDPESYARKYHPLLAEACLAAAAFEHTRRGMYNLLEEADWGTKGSVSFAERGILCSEHLVMFWVVVLPLICGRRFYVLGMYGGALAFMHYLTGLPGLGTFCAGAILLVPVLMVEMNTAGLYDELNQCQFGIDALSKGTGGGTCLVDPAGRLLEASAELMSWWGDVSIGSRFDELFENLKDKEEMRFAYSFDVRPFVNEVDEHGRKKKAGDQEEIYSTRKFFDRLYKREQEQSKICGKEFKVTSMKCAHTEDGQVSARIIPIWKVSGAWRQQLTKFWIEMKKPPAPADELAEREAVLIEKEKEMKERTAVIKEHESYVKEVRASMNQMWSGWIVAYKEDLERMHQAASSDQKNEKNESPGRISPGTETPESAAESFCSADGGNAAV